MDFFEIDEAVIRIAENPQVFTYLADARARPGVTVKTIAAADDPLWTDDYTNGLGALARDGS